VNLKNIRGFSLIEVMIAVGVTSVVSLTVAQLISNTSNNVRNLRTVIARDIVFNQLQRLAGNIQALQLASNYTGSADNGAFASCTGGTATGVAAITCVNNGRNFFSLVDLTGARVAGTSANPVYYTVEGVVCTTPSSYCALEAISEFVAYCPTAASPCAQAMSVDVIVSIQVAGSIQLNFGSLRRQIAQVSSAVPFTSGPGQLHQVAKWLNVFTVGSSGGMKEIPDGAGNFFLGVNLPAAINPTARLDINGTMKLRQPATVNPGCAGAEAGKIRYNSNMMGQPAVELCNGSTWEPLGPYWQ
jgi:prepilin-type N-terminal cleavage/methylation domain-containing protein